MNGRPYHLRNNKLCPYILIKCEHFSDCMYNVSWSYNNVQVDFHFFYVREAKFLFFQGRVFYF